LIHKTHVENAIERLASRQTGLLKAVASAYASSHSADLNGILKVYPLVEVADERFEEIVFAWGVIKSRLNHPSNASLVHFALDTPEHFFLNVS
jgi:hypothetical protein